MSESLSIFQDPLWFWVLAALLLLLLLLITRLTVLLIRRNTKIRQAMAAQRQMKASARLQRKVQRNMARFSLLRDDDNAITLDNTMDDGTAEAYGRFTTAACMELGTRSSQQDALYVSKTAEFSPEDAPVIMGVVCDGMGGLEGGEIASQMSVDLFVSELMQMRDWAGAPKCLEETAKKIDEAVFRMSEQQSGAGSMGTTLAGVLAQGNQLYWLSAGDSRIYILRGDEMIQVTKDHNFGLRLNEMVRAGILTEEEAQHDTRREALISYMGMGGISLIEINQNPLLLHNGDIILLCSDGLTKVAADHDIKACMQNHYYDMDTAAKALVALACGSPERPLAPGRSRDNTSVVLIHYSEYK